MEYALDQLGFLQFEQLVAALFNVAAGIAVDTWSGAADRCRSMISEAPIGRPLIAGAIAAPVLVQCAWIHPGERTRLPAMVRALAAERAEDWDRAQSYVLVTNLDVTGKGVPDVVGALGRSMPGVEVLGGAEISAQTDAHAQLRRVMPSVLGLRELNALIETEVAERSSLDRGAAQALARVFVATGAYRRTLQVLDRHRFVVLTGPPEMGKSAIARMVALAQMTAGWEAYECVRPDDVWRVFNRNRAQVFIADDAFGSTEYRPDAAQRWAREMERILQALDERHWLLWTSRPAPLRTGLDRLHQERGAERSPAPAEVLVDAGALSSVEKTLILFRHAKAANLRRELRGEIRDYGVEIVAHPHFTPERIRRLVATLTGLTPADRRDLSDRVVAELTNATEAMATSFAALGAEHRDLLIAMLDTPPGPVSDQNLAAALHRHHSGALSHSPIDLIDRLTDHFLRVLAGGRVEWVHPSWRDLVIESLAEDDGARERYLRSSSIHGTLLALSTQGGPDGARRLPLLRSDHDWDAVNDRVYQLAAELETAELIGLLDAIDKTIKALNGSATEVEAGALARTALTRVADLWTAAHATISVPELAAWFELAGGLTPRPSPPPIAVTWVDLIPVDPPDLSDYRSMEPFADWLALAELLVGYDPALLSGLGFRDHPPTFIVEFINRLAGDDAPDRLTGVDLAGRALDHIARLFPTLPGNLASWQRARARTHPAEDPPLWDPSPATHYAPWPGRIDVDRVLRDL